MISYKTYTDSPGMINESVSLSNRYPFMINISVGLLPTKKSRYNCIQRLQLDECDLVYWVDEKFYSYF